MDIPVIENALLEQQDELEELRKENLIHRPEEERINLQSKLAQVVIGVRRSGKSTLCFNALEKAGVAYAYANFDDERFEKMESSDLDRVLESLYRIYGKFDYLFLDEIQNVSGWPLFVNRLLRQKMHLIITGSNSKLLSSELASHLTGRHHKIELFPFSFHDWCKIKHVECQRLTTKTRGLLAKAFDEYLHNGGFPELIYESQGKDYIDTLFNNIINQDIKKRFKVRRIEELRKMANIMLDEAPAFINKDGLQETCGIKSDHTVNNYLSYLTQTYLISTISKYSTKSRQRARNEKCYAIDVAFMDKRENAFSHENLGWRLETLVFLELRRRYSGDEMDVYYYKESQAEADFIVCDGNKTVAVYQVSYDITSDKIRRREIRGCIAAARGTKCDNLFIITDSENADIEEQGYKIAIRPAYEWLLENCTASASLSTPVQRS